MIGAFRCISNISILGKLKKIIENASIKEPILWNTVENNLLHVTYKMDKHWKRKCKFLDITYLSSAINEDKTSFTYKT